MKDHILKDELIRGTGWDNEKNKGCAVGCTLDRYDHACYQNELGLPEWLARLEDTLFEGMSLEKSKTFPLKLLEAIPIGVSLDQTYHKMQIYILEEAKSHVEKNFVGVIKVIDDVIDLHLKTANDMINGRFESEPAWSAARSAARSAAESAARSAESAWSAARSAAWSAARSAEPAARSARSAAESAAWSAESARSAALSAALSAARSAESAAFDKMADKLIELLKVSGN